MVDRKGGGASTHRMPYAQHLVRDISAQGVADNASVLIRGHHEVFGMKPAVVAAVHWVPLLECDSKWNLETKCTDQAQEPLTHLDLVACSIRSVGASLPLTPPGTEQ